MATEYLTMAEIEAKYPNEWVVLVRTKSDRYQQILGGYVYGHSADRDESDRITSECKDSKIAVFHTSIRPWKVGPTRWESTCTLLWRLWVISVLVGVGWFSAVFFRHSPPASVTDFGRIHSDLYHHATGVRDGSLEVEIDANGIRRYPLSNELKRAGISVCIERDDTLWYALTTHPLDGGMKYYVTPVSPMEAVSDLPGRLRSRTYHFQLLPANWAYWFKG